MILSVVVKGPICFCFGCGDSDLDGVGGEEMQEGVEDRSVG